MKRNARERNRVQTVNQSFEALRRLVPMAAAHKRLSKVNIIQQAMEYIQQLAQLIDDGPRSDLSSSPSFSSTHSSSSSPLSSCGSGSLISCSPRCPWWDMCQQHSYPAKTNCDTCQHIFPTKPNHTCQCSLPTKPNHTCQHSYPTKPNHNTCQHSYPTKPNHNTCEYPYPTKPNHNKCEYPHHTKPKLSCGAEYTDGYTEDDCLRSVKEEEDEVLNAIVDWQAT
jgi:hypothetical protein